MITAASRKSRALILSRSIALFVFILLNSLRANNSDTGFNLNS